MYAIPLPLVGPPMTGPSYWSHSHAPSGNAVMIAAAIGHHGGHFYDGYNGGGG